MIKIKLKELRKSKGWTQEVAATRLDLSINMVKAIESGRMFSSRKTLEKIYIVFECKSIDELIQAS